MEFIDISFLKVMHFVFRILVNTRIKSHINVQVRPSRLNVRNKNDSSRYYTNTGSAKIKDSDIQM